MTSDVVAILVLVQVGSLDELGTLQISKLVSIALNNWLVFYLFSMKKSFYELSDKIAYGFYAIHPNATSAFSLIR